MARESWKEEAIKLGGESFVKKISDMADSIHCLAENSKLIEEKVVQSEEKIAELFEAFPNADIDGHKRYHETMIEMLEEKRRLRSAIQEKTISGLIWSVIVGLAIILWNYAAHLIRTGVPTN